MKIMKIRRVGNSNVISLPHELEHLGYTAGTSVVVEALPNGDLRIVPSDRVRELIRETGRKVIVKNQESLSLLAEHDQAVDADKHTVAV